jgi:tetratricopeptide (TPR) repeat protein
MERLVAAILAGWFALASPVALAQAPAPMPLRFENSGAPAAQEPFLRGLALLHNFEYPRAAEAFRQAQAADPGFAMAYWGEAMTYNHPIWMEQDAAAARSALARLAPDREARIARGRTDRERGLLEAVEILYGAGSKEDRDRQYAAHLHGLTLRYPDDVDIQSFYALSLLGLAHQGRDVRLYMRAAAQLEPLLPHHPDHPGVLHYLIHSYDDPTHAPLGLRAARRYGDVAPDAPHARHMTSHIFLALGMWDETIEANRAADAGVDRLRAASGHPATSCGHYNEWLVYALYQTERYGDASLIESACRDQVRAHLAGSPAAVRGSPAVSWADMAVRRVVETGRPLGETYSELYRDDPPAARFTLAYADLLSRADDRGRAHAARARLIEIDRALAEAARSSPEPAFAPRRRAIVLAQAEAIEALRSGRAEEGLATLRRAAEAERSMPAEFGPPLVEKPSFELLGDELLRLGRGAEAAAAYRSALDLAPGRRRSVQGLEAASR